MNGAETRIHVSYSELPEIETMDTRESFQHTLVVTPALAGFEYPAAGNIAAALTVILADMFALYIKTKNFHWHVSGPHFRDYHLLLDEQSEQIFNATDAMAERVRKIGGTTLRSIGHIARLQRVADNDEGYVPPEDMLAELLEDNRQLVVSLRAAHRLCDESGDVASASLIENWIDEAEHRAWFLYETTR
jgi:starvation-inducible DNA-binding protein